MRVIKVRLVCIPYILSGSPDECWLHTWDACAITTWRLGLRAPLVTHNYFAKFWSSYFLIWEIYNLSLTSVICSTVPLKSKLTLNSWSSRESRMELSLLLRLDSRFPQDSSSRNALYLQLIIKGFVLSVICSLLLILDCCENLITLVQVSAIF